VLTIVTISATALALWAVSWRLTREKQAWRQLARPVERYREHWSDRVLIGREHSRHRIVVFSDYGCGYCRTLFASIDSMAAEGALSEWAVEWRHYPSLSVGSRLAASIVECASLQSQRLLCTTR